MLHQHHLALIYHPKAVSGMSQIKDAFLYTILKIKCLCSVKNIERQIKASLQIK